MKATYLYKKFNIAKNTVELLNIPVEVLQETDKSFQIKLFGFTDKHKPGDVFWVQKKSVRLPESKPKIPQEPKYDYSDAWWNN